MKIKKLAVLSAAVAALLGNTAAHAQFNYNQGDLLLGFRSTSASHDLVVDIGSASLYKTTLSPIVISGNYYTSSQLSDAGLGLNSLFFSVFGDSSGHDLWATSPSGNPWTAQNVFAQGPTSGKMEAIANGALDASLVNSGPDWTASASVVTNNYNSFGGSDIAYTVGIGANGDFGGAFLGNIETLTGGAFTSGSTSQIMDLYELDVSNAGHAGQLLGDFQLDTNGTLTFNPVPEPGAWSMLGVGALMFAATRKFRRTA
jgi:hypothetical protein